MYWDTLLLLPLFIAVGVYYYELFKPQEDLLKEVDEKIEYSIEDSCASEGSTLLLRYNKRCQQQNKLNSTGNALKSKLKEGSSAISNSTFRE